MIYVCMYVYIYIYIYKVLPDDWKLDGCRTIY